MTKKILMDERRILLWAKGYVDALLYSDTVSKKQIRELIDKLNSLLEIYNQYEPPQAPKKPEVITELDINDLPF